MKSFSSRVSVHLHLAVEKRRGGGMTATADQSGDGQRRAEQRLTAARKKGLTTCAPQKIVCPRSKPPGLQGKRRKRRQANISQHLCLYG